MGVINRLLGLVRGKRLGRELEDELEFHLEMRQRELTAQGMEPEEARREARLRLGPRARLVEECRGADTVAWLGSVRQDVCYAARTLRQSPGFAAAAVFTLALGIGVNTTIFTLFDAVALRLPPVKDPGGLVRLFSTHGSHLPHPDYAHYVKNSRSFTGLVATTRIQAALGDTGERVERIYGLLVSPNYFSVLGLGAALGRPFVPEEDGAPTAQPVVMLGHGFWERRFGGDREIVGKWLTLSGSRFRVVGVAPDDFTGFLAETADILVPLNLEPVINAGSNRLELRGWNWLYVVGRLKPGVALQQAQAELDVLASQLYPETKGVGVRVSRELRFWPGQARSVVMIFALIAAAVMMVLLMACANVANLLLARAAARQREIGIRVSLGAGRGRLIRQLLTESVLLALAGGGAGLLLALWTAKVLTARLAAEAPVALPAGPDIRVLGCALALSLLAAVLFGLAPALQASKPDLAAALKDGGAAAGRWIGRSRLRGTLVAGQVAISVVLLISAGVLLRGLGRAQAIDPGFDTDRVLAVSFDLRLHRYNEAKAAVFRSELAGRLRSLPGVRSLALADVVPFGGRSRFFRLDDLVIHVNKVSPGYFETLGIPILRGRTFSPEESRSGASVGIVSENLARRLWPGQDALGRVLKAGRDGYEIIGVAKDTRSAELWDAAATFLYRPVRPHSLDLALLIRTDGQPEALIAPVERTVHALDRDVRVFASSLQENIDRYLAPSRISATLSTALGVLALLLSSLGIYGVTAYAVSRRTHEIGVRMALGARPSEVLALVLRQGLRPIAIGAALGLAASVAASRLLAGLLAGLSALDPLAFGGVSLLLAVVALAATYVPARKAMKVDPAVALRHE